MIIGGGMDVGCMYLMCNGILLLVIMVFVRYLYLYILVIYEDDYFNIVKLVIEVVKCLDKEIVVKLISY